LPELTGGVRIEGEAARRHLRGDTPVKSVELNRMLRVVAAFGLAVAAVAFAGNPGSAQEAEKGAPLNPKDVYRQFRAHIAEGKFDIAALFLQSFVDSKPTDKDLFELEERYGSTVFSQLRTLRKWSDDPKLDAAARKNVETLNTMLKDATEKVLNDPNRVNKFIRNLGESFEEKEFAKLELKRTGDFAIPFMVDTFRANLNPAVTTGISETIPKLNASTIAGWLVALDGMTPDQQYVVLAKIMERDDVLNLLTKSQTDFRPQLWHLAGSSPSPTLKGLAAGVLEKIVPGAARKQPEAELVAAAKVFADHKGTWLGVAASGDGSPSMVPVWTWNAATNKLELNPSVPVGQADEYFGLRYGRWALDKTPDYEPAQVLLLSIAAERAMDRGKFGELSRTDPAVYKMLADAPSKVLADLLDRGLVEKRTGLVLALVQAIGDRAEKGDTKLLERALDYGDPRVQLAAANALLRGPTPASDKVRVKIVEILRRAAGVDPMAPEKAKGQALIADPNRQRADDAAILLRGLGYDTEIYSTGRDLLKRTLRASDFDIVLIDHHLPNPELGDVVAQLRADTRAAKRPILVIASTDHPVPPTIDQLLLRLALLIAATETDPIGMPAPYAPDPKKSEEDQAKDRKTNLDRRDDVFRTTLVSRVDRLQRVIDTTGIELTDDQKFQLKLRMEQVTAAVLAAEYPLTAESAPRAYSNYVALMKQIGIQPSVAAYKRRVGVDHLMKLIERLEIDVAGNKPAGDKYEALRGRLDGDLLGLNVSRTRDPEAEAKLTKQLRNVSAVRVIPEPVGRTWLEADINAAFADPADRPRDPAEKKAAAKLAVAWLTKMATGEVLGYDPKAAAAELIGSLRSEDTADVAIDGAVRFPTAAAQQGLITTAVTIGRALPLRVKAADAAIRHVQLNGKLTQPMLIDAVAEQAGKEMDADLRGKLIVLKALLAPNAKDYVKNLKDYAPPLVPPPPMMPAPEPKPKEKDEKE
jgi:CheY-like chemotaxis protein